MNKKGFLEKSLEIKSPSKRSGNHLKALNNPLTLLFSVGLYTVDEHLNHLKIIVPLFGAEYLHQIKAQKFYTYLLIQISPIHQSSVLEVEC